MSITLTIPHYRLTKSRLKDSCDLCGQRRWDIWSMKSMMMLCRECALSNYYREGELFMWLHH